MRHQVTAELRNYKGELALSFAINIIGSNQVAWMPAVITGVNAQLPDTFVMTEIHEATYPPVVEEQQQIYCICPACIHCGCGLWKAHHRNLSEVVRAQ